MRDFKKLEVWKRGHRLTLDVYGVTRAFPREELYGITSQMRRASAAISANVAEGCGRASNADLARFLQIAFGSASELENHPLLARDLLFLQPTDYKRLSKEVIEIQLMLASFIRSLKAFGNQSRKPCPND
ncbi:MAG TPA: four helix bundle protein [Rubrobacteraceae bacterium]|jgi:four helix bundle protein|nr:four helix bundle protein [Rubrobacteraceae bacterium]